MMTESAFSASSPCPLTPQAPLADNAATSALSALVLCSESIHSDGTLRTRRLNSLSSNKPLRKPPPPPLVPTVPPSVVLPPSGVESPPSSPGSISSPLSVASATASPQPSQVPLPTGAVVTARPRTGTRVLIRQGKPVEQPNPLHELNNDQRLEILLAVRNAVLTMDEALNLGAQVVLASQENNPTKVAELLQQAKGSPKKKVTSFSSRDVDISVHSQEYLAEQRHKGPDPRDLQRLDDVQRLSILQAVASGKLSQDEAISLVQQVRHCQGG